MPSEEELLSLLEKLVRTAYEEGRNGVPFADSKARQAIRRINHLKQEVKDGKPERTSDQSS